MSVYLFQWEEVIVRNVYKFVCEVKKEEIFWETCWSLLKKTGGVNPTTVKEAGVIQSLTSAQRLQMLVKPISEINRIFFTEDMGLYEI